MKLKYIFKSNNSNILMGIKDNNLIPGNIKSGVEVYGIHGDYTGNPGINVKDTPVNLPVVPFSGTVANRLARALVNLDGKLYLMWNDKLYLYSDRSNSWTEYDSNVEFLGPKFGAGDEENPIADDAVLIGSNIVWLYVANDKVHARWYEVYNKTLKTQETLRRKILQRLKKHQIETSYYYH